MRINTVKKLKSVEIVASELYPVATVFSPNLLELCHLLLELYGIPLLELYHPLY